MSCWTMRASGCSRRSRAAVWAARVPVWASVAIVSHTVIQMQFAKPDEVSDEQMHEKMADGCVQVRGNAVRPPNDIFFLQILRVVQHVFPLGIHTFEWLHFISSVWQPKHIYTSSHGDRTLIRYGGDVFSYPAKSICAPTHIRVSTQKYSQQYELLLEL